MNKQRQYLNRYIDNYVSEIKCQFYGMLGPNDDWLLNSVHAEYAAKHLLCDVYEYDRTDDGPECEVITKIRAAGYLYGER